MKCYLILFSLLALVVTLPVQAEESFIKTPGYLSLSEKILTAGLYQVSSSKLKNRVAYADSSGEGLKIKFSLWNWIATGDSSLNGGPPTANNSWLLEHEVDGNIWIGKLELIDQQVKPSYSFDFYFGQGGLKDGAMTDTDWDASGKLWFLSESTSKGKTQFYHLYVGYAVHNRPEPVESAQRIETCFGYLYLKNSVSYNDPTVLMENYVTTNISWSEEWQDYDLVYRGFAFRIKGKFQLNKKLLFQGALGYVPLLVADYDGLRYPNRPANQQQREQIAADGTALEYEMTLNYRLNDRIQVLTGYKYMKFDTEGEDKAGTPWAGCWEKLETDFGGLMYGVFINF